MERLNLKKSEEVELINRFAALENLDVKVDITRTWGTIRDSIHILATKSLGFYKLKNKPWYDEGPNYSNYMIQMGHAVA
jgi:hypothetical protein